MTNQNTPKKYQDKLGDIWVRSGSHKVIRLKDGNIGLWRNGEGLIEL